MRKPLIFLVAFMILLMLGLPMATYAEQEVCPSGNGWVKYENLSGHTFTVTIPEGYMLVSICYKAGRLVEYINFDPPIVGPSTYVLEIQGQNELSHVSVLILPWSTPTPTSTCTATPTLTPTATWTVTPTDVPTVTPTDVPTVTPTDIPTDVPTVTPTDIPTATPTDVPTATPTDVPTVTPTDIPTLTPTDIPTVTPTDVPTATPTDIPTVTPTDVPTATPTEVPTVTPTEPPTETPVNTPTPNIIIDVGTGANNGGIKEGIFLGILFSLCLFGGAYIFFRLKKTSNR